MSKNSSSSPVGPGEGGTSPSAGGLGPSTPGGESSGAASGSETSVSFTLTGPARVGARIFDAEGRLRRSLLESEGRAAGLHRLHWYGRDEDGREMPSGVYFGRVRSAGQAAMVRVVYAK